MDYRYVNVNNSRRPGTHQARKIWPTGLQNEMVVVAHQAVGKNCRLEALQCLRQYGQEGVSVAIVLKDRLTPIPTRGEMVQRAFEFKP
jgi:hypothetical protein